MRTIAPYHGLTFGKLNGPLRLAAHPPQIVVRLRIIWVTPRPGKARAPIKMRSEIARQYRPKA
eukprot:6926643-Prymnesium_polylepis.1